MRAHPQRPRVSFTFDPGSTDTPHKDRQQDPAQVTCKGHRTVLTTACGICSSAVLLALLHDPCGNANNLRCRGRPYERDSDRRRSQDRLTRTKLVRVEPLQSTSGLGSDMAPIVAVGTTTFTRKGDACRAILTCPRSAVQRQPERLVMPCGRLHLPVCIKAQAPFRQSPFRSAFQFGCQIWLKVITMPWWRESCLPGKTNPSSILRSLQHF